MRRAAVLSIGVLEVATATLGVVSLTPGQQAATATAVPPDDSRTVEYGGLRLAVPDGWRVYRLDGEPHRCVRYDQNAVYLGTPSGEPDCPARVVGRTEAIHVTALPGAAGGAAAGRSAQVSLADLRVAPTVDREMSLDLPQSGVRVTGVWGEDRALLERTLRTATAGPGSAPQPEPADLPEITRRAWTEGHGFDTCTAPALRTMAAWRSAYTVANIYIGGAARGCAQPQLDRTWVRQVRSMGYRLIPTYVGPQAPCSSFRPRITRRDPESSGRRSATDAVAKAIALGIPRGRPLYFDIEAYSRADKGCRTAVLRFLDSWTTQLHRFGYRSGVYSSAASGIRDLAEAGPAGMRRPDAVWFARWDGRKRVSEAKYLPDDLWHPHRRIKQYRGGHAERHGGVKLNVDSNVVDGLVY